MKVLLIQPPVQDFYDTDVRLQPIGLCYLKAAMQKHLPDVEVIVTDAHGGAGRRTAAIPKELRYLADYYSVNDKSPFSTFHRYYHFGNPSTRSKTKSPRSSPTSSASPRSLPLTTAKSSKSPRA
jgi:hypothetical protein